MGKNQPSKNAGSCSIDHWQDPEKVPGLWLDNPLWGALLMGCATAGLVAWTALAADGGKSNHPSPAPSPTAIPVPMAAIPEGESYQNEMNRQAANRSARPEILPTGESTVTGNQPKGDVSALLQELIETDANGRSRYEIKQDLARNGCDNPEIVRRLSEQLRITFDANRFEKILSAVSDVSYVVSDNPEIKQQFVNALAFSSRRVKISELKTMDQRVTSLILDTTMLPQSSGVLGKLAAIDDHWAQRVLSKLDRLKSDMASKVAVKIVRDHKLDPKYLRDTNSAVVCQFLWEGKLSGKQEFQDANTGNSETSIQAFSQASSLKLDGDPRGTIKSMMSLSLHLHPGINRKSLPESLLNKVDNAMATQVKTQLVDGGASVYELTQQGEQGQGPFAFLKLAKHLAGSKTVVAIAKMANRNPDILKKYLPIRDLLLSVNEPESYDAIAASTAFHGTGRSVLRYQQLGAAIESSFCRRLQSELQMKPSARERSDWVKRIQNLVSVIALVGTENSVPALKKLATNQNSLLKSLGQKTLSKIQGTTKAATKPNRTPRPEAKEEGTIRVTTNSGEAFRSSVSNIVQGRIPRSSLRDRLSFDPDNMWHSAPLKNGWATIELDFPQPVTLDRIQIYSQHTGKNHPVIAAKVYSVAGRQTKLLCEPDGLKQEDWLRFQSTTSKKWKLELQAGATNKIVVRGLRFFDRKRERYPQKEIEPDTDE